jgi:hypothetical protein
LDRKTLFARVSNVSYRVNILLDYCQTANADAKVRSIVEHDSLKKHLSERMTEREYLILDRISVYTRKFESEYIKDKSMLKNCNNECTPVKNEWQLKHCLFSNSSPILRIEKFADFRYWSIDH